MKYPDILERFLSYVAIDTQSSDSSETFPSTAKQKDLAVKLKPELEALGLQDVQVTSWGYVLAALKTNQAQPVPTIALIAHMDTSPAVSGTGVQPKLHRNYQGQDLVLSASENVVLKTGENPYLLEKIGKTIITATHDLSILEEISDRAVVMEEYHTIIAQGRGDELMQITPKGQKFKHPDGEEVEGGCNDCHTGGL